ANFESGTLASVVTVPGGQVSGNISGNAANVTGTVAVGNGGTGTSSPALVAGSNISITGSWPNQTINAAGSGLSVSGTPTANYDAIWNNSSTLKQGLLYESGTSVGINTGGTPNAQLDIKGSSEYEINTGNSSYVQLQVGSTAVARVYAN
ncbi:MAG TPA: hypothetical protein VNH15_01035, partial [Elusimicrobiota bacterium]|nr:hypothetical protein [Elusimicrobiota bacterium]